MTHQQQEELYAAYKVDVSLVLKPILQYSRRALSTLGQATHSKSQPNLEIRIPINLYMAASHSADAPFPATAALSAEFPATHHPTPTFPSPLKGPDEQPQRIPGKPTVNPTLHEIYDHLVRDLDTPVLDDIYPKLWLVGRKSGKSIDPLHRQSIKGRAIVPSEDPKLHLVWNHDKIYLKPIPVYLLNHDFWTTYLPLSRDTTWSREKDSSPKFDRSILIGFLRSYAFLIQHPLDTILARQHHLVQVDVDWIEWSKFIVHFRQIEDSQVAKRYHYGQLRLSRLNWAMRILRPRGKSTTWFYEIPHWSTGSYMERVIAPLLFVFTSLSLVLSSMQVVLSVPADGLGFLGLDSIGLQSMRRAFWGFSITVLFVSGAIWTLLVVIPAGVIGWQLVGLQE